MHFSVSSPKGELHGASYSEQRQFQEEPRQAREGPEELGQGAGEDVDRHGAEDQFGPEQVEQGEVTQSP